MHARQKRRSKKITDSHHAFPVAPNIIAQDFAATGPNQKWVPTFHIVRLAPIGEAYDWNAKEKGGCEDLPVPCCEGT